MIPSHDKTNIDFVYIETPICKNSIEETFLLEQSKKTFSQNNEPIIIFSNDVTLVKVGEILNKTEAELIAICTNNRLYHSTGWIEPLIEAINSGFDLASCASNETTHIELFYNTPSELDKTSAILRQVHKDSYTIDTKMQLLSFVVKRSGLQNISPQTLLSDLPKTLKSCIVPASYSHKFVDYYLSKRDDMLSFIPHNAHKVLDIGCARGYFGESIKKATGCKVYGIEINETIAKDAQTRLDEVIVADIERGQIDFHQEFDVIIFADVLEHLIDPWAMVKKTKKWLTPKGVIIASIPNTAHYSIICDLLNNRWNYTPSGLLCITHLRFFTKISIENMFSDAGYSSIKIIPHAWQEDQKEKILSLISPFIHVENASESIFHHGYYVIAENS